MNKAQIVPDSRVNVIINGYANGSIVCLPTDTVFAVSCIATDKEAIERIYRIKGRSKNKPLSVFVSDYKMLKKYGKLSDFTEKMLKEVWPSPLTIILPQSKNCSRLPGDLYSNDGIALRIPNNALIREICKIIDLPIIATSANKSFKKEIVSFFEAEKIFSKQVDILVKPTGNYNASDVSKIIKIERGNRIKVIRSR